MGVHPPQRAQLLKKSTRPIHYIGGKAQLEAVEVARTLNQSCYPQLGLSINLSLSTGVSIQDEAMGVARSAPQGAHHYVDVIYLNGNK